MLHVSKYSKPPFKVLKILRDKDIIHVEEFNNCLKVVKHLNM